MNRNAKYDEEDSLIPLFRADDLNAFRSVYEMFYRQLFNYANRILKDPEQVEDILSECFVILWKKRAEFHSLKSIGAYLYTITRNSAISHLRKRKRKTQTHREIMYLLPQSATTDIARAMKEDLIQFSIIAAERLPPGMKKIFQLMYLDGFGATEVALKLNLSVKTVNAQKINAIKRIKDTLIKKGLLAFLGSVLCALFRYSI